MKTPKERNNKSLLELTLELHHRLLVYDTKELADAYSEARTELEKRFKTSNK